MKGSFWFWGAGGLAWLLAGPGRAQSLAGAWQGVETKTGEDGIWPSMLRLQPGRGELLFGVLYQEVGSEPETTVTFQVQGTRSGPGLRLEHVRKLDETRRSPFSYWCYGSITFTYDATLEKLTGVATYLPQGDCDTGTFTFYRIKLKSAASVPAGALSTLRVSGRDVRWFADPERKQPLATGNSYRTKLTKTTTFYLTQGYYPTADSPAVPITIQVAGTAKAAPTPRPTPKAPSAPAAPAPTPTPPAPADSLAATPPAPTPAPAPVVLPTVLFQLGTAELLPTGGPALKQLAADLLANPALRLRIAGHTDRIGEPGKNQVLSEQRAEAVKAYLTKAGVAADRIQTSGYGDTRPLYPSPDPRNRRVEIEKLP
ncbi:OmpA family protein [Hymenobacter sp. HMF4947]|uniref:OmpA family protein n=1 Tax=Hymenobacter ginkgonis TaxID=2682976 RepID=A0A7K1TFN8_9BACT|nr:OmpA family protein [Hymenobacter ginkgonis]MVN77220.1 OmpA family protein [Hymenobacter ginkgonis]